MPTYEYMCQACGHRWEAFQRMKDDPLRLCPVCAEPQAKRQISAGTGFILKGGGWYSDLYASSGAQKSQQKSNGNGGASESKSDKTDKSDSTSPSKEATKKEPSKGTSAGT